MRSRLIVAAALALAAVLWPAAALAAPANDTYPGQTLSGSVAEVSGSTVGATTQSGEPHTMYYSSTGTVWYSWTAPSDGTVLLHTGGSDFSPTIAVYTGSALTGLHFVAGHQTQYAEGSLEFDAAAGTTYRLQVGGYGTATGHLELQVIQDTAAPTIGAPKHAFALGSEQYSDSIPLTFTWTQADTGGSGICQVNLRYSEDGGPFQVTYGYTHQTAWFEPGHSYRWGIQAIDCAHNASGWIAGPTVGLTAVDQTAATLAKAWSLGTGEGYFGGTDRYSAVKGASATYHITARAIAVVAPKGPNRGTMDVFVDGKLFTTINLASRYGTYSQILARKAFTTSGPHTVKLVAHAAKRVDADAIAGMSW